MTKIRKQPQRSTKNKKQLLVKNIFTDETLISKYRETIPIEILKKLMQRSKIEFHSIDEFVCQPKENMTERNMKLMKKAATQQEHAIPRQNGGLKVSSMQNISLQLEQTKNTRTNQSVESIRELSVHEYNQSHSPFYNLDETPVEKKLNCPQDYLDLQWGCKGIGLDHEDHLDFGI